MRNPTSRLIVAATFAVAATASGCAFGNRQVNLTYAASLPAASTQPPTWGRVAVARFRDARDPKQGTGSLLGKVRNGYGMPTASVLANQDPILWVNEGVARALVAQGLTVERVDAESGPPEVPTITGAVTRVSGGMYMSMDANISADLAIEQGGRSVSTVACRGQAKKVAWTASTDEYRTVFEAAMTDFATQCGSSLARILTGGSP